MTKTDKSMLPADHPDRLGLNDEVHARPTEALPPRVRITYLVMFGTTDDQALRDLCARFDVAPPEEAARHFSADMGAFRLKWERHTEFIRYWFIAPADSKTPLFSKNGLEQVPRDWLEKLQGSVLVATHVELLPRPRSMLNEGKMSREFFNGNTIVGSDLSGGRGRAVTDFRIHEGGFGRFLIYHDNLTPLQRGRTVQRLLEIDTYRVLALLALPVARTLTPLLENYERELTEITATMREASEDLEPELLDRLTLLHSDIVRQHTGNQYRFSAALAYKDLVHDRINELREQRIEGLQTFAEFTDRRLSPAMKTCEATANRLSILSERVARATQLLSTRVDMSLERQNQKLLESMERRAGMQLRLQQTVEGLSIAAISYYIVGLIGYVLKGTQKAGFLPWSLEVAVAGSIPVVLLVVAWSIRRARKSLTE